MSLPRALAILLIIAMGAWARPAFPQDAIALGFIKSEGVRLASVTSIPRLPRKAIADANAWELSAIASTSETLWQIAFRAPRAFHAGLGSDVAFTVTGPRPPAGAQLVLVDDQGSVLWQVLVDDAFLAVADDNGVTASKQIGGAEPMTKAAMTRPASAALSRQVATIRAKGETGGRTFAADTAQKATKPSRPVKPAASALQRSGPSGALPKDGEVPVTVRFLDDSGNAPGEAFSGGLYDPIMGVSNFQVDGNGIVTLQLAIGRAYQLFLAPPMPFISSSLWFTYDGTPPTFMLERGWMIDVMVRNATTGVPLASLGSPRIYSAYRQSYHPTTVEGSHARAAVPKDPDLPLGIEIFRAPGFATSVHYPLGTIDGDTTMAVEIEPAKDVPIRVRDTDGHTLHDGWLWCQSISALNDVSFESRADLTQGAAVLPIATSTAYECSAHLLEGYTRTLRNLRFNGQASVWDLPATRTTRIDIVDASGNPIDDRLYGHWADDTQHDTAYCNDNPCLITTPIDRAVSITFEFEDPAYGDVQLPATIYSTDPSTPVLASHQYTISGHVEQTYGGYTFDRVRALDRSGNFVISTIANQQGDFTIPLPLGDFVLELERNREDAYAGGFFYEKTTHVGPIHVDSDSNLGTLSHDGSRGDWLLDIQTPCSIPGEPAYRSDAPVAVSLVADDGTRVHKIQGGGESTGSSGNGMCGTRYSVPLSPGTYRAQAAPAGWLPRDFGTISIHAGGGAPASTASFPADARVLVWKPVFKKADGSTAGDFQIQMFNQNQTPMDWFVVGAGEQATVPYQPGWFAEARPAADGYGMRQLIRFGEATATAGMIVNDLPFDEGAPEAGLFRMLGDGDRERKINILVLGDGYTAERESFTDLNDNGVWDGLVWFDLNHNGILDHQVDQFGAYGDVEFPDDGIMPDVANEPFEDINGDGVPNLDDPALFRLNAESFLRSLFGSDFFDARIGGVNAYVLFEPSRQSGHGQQGGIDGEGLIRDTIYGANATPEAALFADAAKLQSRAATLLPETDVIVLLVNDVTSMPKRSTTVMGGDFAVVTMWSGRYATDALSTVPAHEMGHALAGLCDEYAEFIGPATHVQGPAFGCANVATSPRREDIPWKDMIVDETSIPTRHLDGSIGVYEGASGFTGGRYRPTFHSMMRYASPLFNAPSRAALERAMADADGDASAPRTRPGPPAHSRIRKPPPL